MPTLQFKGKNIIWNHHMSVPYHTLERVEELDFQADRANGNIIVEGDNLTALKALLPEYAGKVKCIYIDPPYNTGEEHWVYNDNVNSPIIKNWIGKEVGKDDLTKHDKWLCMMTPRLKLLNELLKPEDGVIFISIDDNEQANLKLLCDAVFGENNFVATVIWEKKFSPQNDAKWFSDNHDYILVYAKNKEIWRPNKLERTEESNSRYSNPDNDPRGPWASSDMTVKTYTESNDYPITTPSGRVVHPTKGRCWAVSYEKFLELVEDNRIWFGKDGNNVPRYKTFLSEVDDGLVPLTIWKHSDVGHNQEARQQLKEIFDGEAVFDSPKPVRLLKRIFSIATDKNDIILDSFAGSGTTAHAVMDLNKEDGGNRRYILVQMPENSEKEPEKNICRDVTRERIVRAIERFGYDSGFEYLRVGQALDAETLLSGELPEYETFAKYVYYLATGEHPGNEAKIDQESYFVGSKDNEDIYLIYTDDMDALQKLALSYEKAEAIRKRSGAKKAIVYAPACFLDEEDLQELKIEFVSIPYNLFERKAEA